MKGNLAPFIPIYSIVSGVGLAQEANINLSFNLLLFATIL